MKIRKKGKQLFAVLLSVAMIITTLPLGAITANAVTTEFAGGSGTQADPYLIKTKEHFNNVRNHLSAHYKMISDIVFSVADFAEDGDFYKFYTISSDPSNAFTGTFDGNGHIIQNLKFPVKTDLTGLFGCNKGTIKNVGIVDVFISTDYGKDYAVSAGSIAGWNYGTIENCYSTGSVSALDSDYTTYAGGLVGINQASGTIKSSYSICDVLSKEGYSGCEAGGIAGLNRGTIENCYNKGNVTASSFSKISCAGGILGYNYGIVNNCYNTGTISSIVNSANDSCAGGILGYNAGEIKNCYNTGNVTATGVSSLSFSVGVTILAGGIAGYNKSEIEGCFNSGNILSFNKPFDGNDGTSYGTNASCFAGGIAGYNYGKAVSNCYNKGDVSTEATAYYEERAYSGGIAGYGGAKQCYNIGIVSASAKDSIASGITGSRNDDISESYYCYSGKTIEELMMSSTYAGFDFEEVWTMEGNECYPYAELKNITYISDHIYTSGCDTTCNCGYKRTTIYAHEYKNLYDENNHFRKCSRCYNIINRQDHLFDNDCDANCSCGYTRTVPEHIFDNACDTTCNVCGTMRTIVHMYSSDCDTICNICSDTRTAIKNHTFIDGCDLECNECDYIRTLKNITINSEPQKTEYLERKENLDVTGGKLTLYYTDGTSGEITITSDMVSGFDNTKAGNQKLIVTYGGCTTSFEIEILAKKLIDINITQLPSKTEYLENKEILDLSGGKLTLYYNNGTSHQIDLSEATISGFDNSIVGPQTLTVTYEEQITTYDIVIKAAYIKGDINNDNVINLNDVVALSQVVAGWQNIVHNALTLDVNGDGNVNLSDVVLLAQYVAGWNVTLY